MLRFQYAYFNIYSRPEKSREVFVNNVELAERLTKLD